MNAMPFYALTDPEAHYYACCEHEVKQDPIRDAVPRSGP